MAIGILCSAVFWMSACSDTTLSPVPEANPYPTDLATELLQLDTRHGRATSTDAQKLNDILDDMVRAMGEKPIAPRHAGEARRASEIMNRVLAEHNFLQPEQYSDWPDTLHQAFRPNPLSSPKREQLLKHQGNVSRVSHHVFDQPVFYLDCDMGSLLMLSAAERLDWPMSLVLVPDHAYVIWHLPNDETFNWDWSYATSRPSSDYMVDAGVYAELIANEAYLAPLSRDRAKGYFLAAMAAYGKGETDRLTMIRMAGKLDPTSPITQSLYAWNMAALKTATKNDLTSAAIKGQAALKVDPQNSHRALALACVYARLNKFGTAQDLLINALSIPGDDAIKEQIEINLSRIKQQDVCDLKAG